MIKTPNHIQSMQLWQGLKYLFTCPQGTFRQRFAFVISLIFTSARHNLWWHEIKLKNGRLSHQTPEIARKIAQTGRLILGAIPLEEHRQALAGVDHFLTLLNDYELKPSIVNPLQECDRTIIAAKDFEPLTSEQLTQGVTTIHTQLAANKTIYVHCKAGVGRSASVVLAWMMQKALNAKKPYKTVEDAYTDLKRIRPQVNLRSQQLQAVRKWCLTVHPV